MGFVKKTNKEKVLGVLRQLVETAPDQKAIAAAREVLRTRAVSGSVSTDGKILFGQMLGQDRTTYNISVDLSTQRGRTGPLPVDKYLCPTLRCTCPSRKFPCKHEYALIMMYLAGGCQLLQPLPHWLITGRMDRQKELREKGMNRCLITDRIIRQSLEYYDGTLLQFVQGEMKDALEDMLLLPVIIDSPEVTRTRAFLAVLLTSKILLSKLSTGRPWGRGEETIGTMAGRERALEEGLRELTWEDIGHSHVRQTLSGLLQDASDHRVIRTTTHQLQGRQEHDRSLLDVDEAERNFPVCDLALEIFARASAVIDANEHAKEQLVFFGELFAHLMEKGTVGWTSRVQYTQLLLDIGPENYEQWRQVNEFQLNKLLQEKPS